MIPKKLRSESEKELLAEHLKTLGPEDRYLRFGHPANDEAIQKYVDSSWESEGRWMGIIENGKIIAAIHVALEGEGRAELGLTVDPRWRGKKLGQSLFERSIVYLKARHVKDVFMHCLSENAVMKHIASKNHMKMFSSYGETEADLHLPDSTPIDAYCEVVVEQLAIYDNNVRGARNVWKTILGIRPNET